jgi:hypothetical protein
MVAMRPRKRRNPRKARFFAEQKMRPEYSDSLFIVGGLDGAGS